MMRPPPGWSSRDECGTKTRRLLLLLSPGTPSRVVAREKRPLFETTKASLSTKGGKTEPRRRPCWASKGNTNACLRLRAALSYLPIFVMILSFSLSLSLSKKRSLSKSSSSLERDDDDPPPLFLPLCRRCCSLDEKQSQQHQQHRKQREREQRFLAASFETFFFLSLFFVCLS